MGAMPVIEQIRSCGEGARGAASKWRSSSRSVQPDYSTKTEPALHPLIDLCPIPMGQDPALPRRYSVHDS